MEDLASVIDRLYTTPSDVERREITGKLSEFFTTASSWSALVNLFNIALSATSASSQTEIKRRHRVCFFAANALLNKIKKEHLNPSNITELVTSIHSLLLFHDSSTGTIISRDPTEQLLGRAAIKRLVLCLAALTSANHSTFLNGYIDHATMLLHASFTQSNAPNILGLEMLLAVVNPASEDEENEDSSNYPDTEISIHLREYLPKVLGTLEVYIEKRRVTADDSALILEVLRAWIRLVQDISKLKQSWPALFVFILSSISQGDASAETLRSSSSLIQLVANQCSASENKFAVKDALIEAMMFARVRFSYMRDDEDACHAIASAFARIAELDVDRIARGQCPKHVEMTEFAIEILAHPSRSSVSRNALDFFLCLQDVPVIERCPYLNEGFFLGLLGQLVISCQISGDCIPETPDDEDGADDVLLFRTASDGPKDLFASVYAILTTKFVQELVAIVTDINFDFIKAESALFALRSSSREICTNIIKNDPDRLQRTSIFKLYECSLKSNVRREMYFRSALCASIGDFCAIFHLLNVSDEPSQAQNNSIVFLALKFLVENLEDPAADQLLLNRACASFQRICSRHAKIISTVYEMIIPQLFSNACHPFHIASVSSSGRRKIIALDVENRKAVAEGLSRLCTVHPDPSYASRTLLEPLLHRIRSSSTSPTMFLEIVTLASAVKFLPPDTKPIVENVLIYVTPLLESVFNGGILVDGDDLIESLSDLISAFFFCCSSALSSASLDTILLWVINTFKQHPMACLATNAGKAIELFSNKVLSEKRCNEVILSLAAQGDRLISSSPDTLPACLETIRRAFLFSPEAFFLAEAECRQFCDLIVKCIMIDEREPVREACVLLADVITRTRRSSDMETRWSVYGEMFDKILYYNGTLNQLCEHIARSLMARERQPVFENLADFLYCTFRAYPSISIEFFNGTLEDVARSGSKEAFRRHIRESASHRKSS